MVSRSARNGWRDETSFALTYKSPIQRHKSRPWTLWHRIIHVYDENVPETEVLFHLLGLLIFTRGPYSSGWT